MFVPTSEGLAVLVSVEEGWEVAVPEAVVFVELSCSSGTMTASRICIRPL